MFNINHVAISVVDINKSIEFYSKFGFQKFKEWKAEDDSIKINMLKLNIMKQIIDFFLNLLCTEPPRTKVCHPARRTTRR